ncbi:MAG: SH3 domain-containing protein [Gammaproteobacteria bacterium]|nr:SH3 domain-containing protein [Gammaproteobacteria bacterium]
MLTLVLLVLLPAGAGARRRELLQLFVTTPYLELHTGPGRGYPVAQVVARGESVDVLLRRTEWFKVRTERGIVGWARERDLEQAELADGSRFAFNRGDRSAFTSHGWEGGILTGDYAGATVISVFGARSLNDNLKIELLASQYLGNIYDGYLLDIGLNHVVFPEWRFSPFLMLGTGWEQVVSKATLADPIDATNQSAYAGVGARFYLTRRFYLRGDYRHHVVFTSRDNNEVKNEWKLGFAFFY